MRSILSYEKGHLLLAAIRVLAHQREQAPTAGEIVELVGLPEELVGALLHELCEAGIARGIESPFDTRYEIADHVLLEDLPREAESPKLRQEVERFQQKARGRHEAIEQMFGDPQRAKKRQERMSQLEKDLKSFKKGGRPPHPFGEDDD